MPPPEGNNHPARHRWISALLLFGVGALLLLIGIGIHRPHTKSEFFASFFQHLGIGLVAVSLLKFFIEEAAQQQFLNLLRTDVKNQVGTTVISFIRRGSWILTNAVLKKELEESILLPTFTRPAYDLRLKLEPLETHADLFKVWITFEYYVKNVSDRPEPYPVNAWLDDVIRLDDLAAESKPGFRHIQIGGTTYNGNQTDLEKKLGTDKIHYERGMIEIRGLLTPIINPEERLKIIVEGMQIMRNADHFVWNLPTITHELTLSIELAGGLTFDQMEVWPNEMHHISHEEFMSTLDRAQPNIWKLKISHVVLPFQGVELRWAPKFPPRASISSPPTFSSVT